ncbi:odorant receptor 4-like isoform X3 [Galleria mellonella]|uniref:Odorant receptor n=1 Tax=Galleria mellonella TaxID=7137 RepID=A0A6J3C3Y6_GALME|nr:odorant receptor 4-like isoform X3 [Galleria mellonella]
MTLLRKIKKLFTKEDYDFDSPDVNLRNFHPQLYIYLAAMGIFTNNRDSRLRFILPTVYISFTFIGVAFESIGLFHGVIVQDYAFATESFFYFLFLLMDLTVVCSVLYNKDEILQLLEDMNNDFIFIRTMESKHRDTFMAGQLFIHKLCCTWHLVPIIIDSLYISLMLCPLVIQGLFNTDSDVNRPLMFPLWLPADDPYRTPNYEIFVVLEIGFLMVATLLFGDESVACLLPKDPLRKQVQSTLNSRMKRIVNWHLAVFKSLKTVSSVFGPPIIYQVMFSSIAICLLAYQVADSLEQGKLDIIFVMLLLASFVQVWIPCYIGTLLRDKGFAVGDACWNSGWHETRLGTLIRTDMVLVMQHSQKPLVIKFIGLPQLQLETFSSIMTTAYSYFNMLRQYNSDS